MYGAAEGEELLDETAPLRPLTPYAESKVRAEEAICDLADSEFIPVSMRNATAYGVSPKLRLDIVLNNLVALGAHDRGDQVAQRRHAHGVRSSTSATSPRSACYVGCACRAGQGRGVQRRLDRAELPDPRPRRRVRAG